MIVWVRMKKGGKTMEKAGRFTGHDLSNVTPLTMPWIEVNGLIRPDFSLSSASLSLELAATAYDLELDAWREAGWRDVSYLVDQELFTGYSTNARGIAGAVSEYFQRLARSRIRNVSPISQIRGALRPKEESDTCKAVVMIHPAPGGRYVVAIGFMGTGKRIYDWVSNFRMSREEGLHQGFAGLAREFEDNCDKILFPQTARELNLPSLTLSDIFQECRRPGSRFLIWMAGHSQGGAVMQICAFREIRKGFLRQNMIGYGFASPSVVYENPGCDLSAFPLYHIINADDLTPRVGAALHIGRCRVFLPDEEMRKTCYAPAWNTPVFRSMLALLHSIRNTQSGLLFIIALLKALQNLPDNEFAAAFTGLIGRLMPEKLLEALGDQADDILQRLIAKTQRVYLRASGDLLPPRNALLQLQKRISLFIARYGARAFVKAFLQAFSLPHKLRGTESQSGVASYQYIVTRRFKDLAQRIWCAPAPSSAPRAARPAPVRYASRFARYSTARSRHLHR